MPHRDDDLRAAKAQQANKNLALPGMNRQGTELAGVAKSICWCAFVITPEEGRMSFRKPLSSLLMKAGEINAVQSGKPILNFIWR